MDKMMNRRSSKIFAGVHQAVRAGLGSSIARNMTSLYALQFANYVVPLIVVPYLVRVLGPAGYGAVAFAQSLISYIILFVEYGFDWSATRRISVERSNASLVNWIAVHVWAAKTLLSLISFALLLLLIYTVPKLREVSLLLFTLYGLVLGSVLFPTWLFQGMERMVTISLINLSMKLLILVTVFTLVRSPEDAILYAALVGGGAVAAGLVGTTVALRMFGLKPVRVSITGVTDVLKDGWVLFLSKASVSLYTVGNAFILGMLTNHTIVGYYSAAEKLTKAILGLLGPISQATYPRFSNLASKSKEVVLLWARRMLLLMGSTGCFLSGLVALGAPVIVVALLGSSFTPSIAVMRLLAPTIFLIALSNVLGIQVMLPFGKDKAFTLILLAAGVLNVAGAIVLVPIWQASGMAASVLISELFVTVTMLVYLHARGLSLLTIKAL